MPKEMQPHTAVPTWDSLSPGEKQEWLLNQALDCKRDILTMPLPDPNDDSIEAHRVRMRRQPFRNPPVSAPGRR
jgi:hypothetical protein